ncbi:hypothetical protein [Haloglomus litoreum]|uniref:hypothetical protein n=1 Tax=Haloglomus litoreum TaxID=3034026 RepID=UPI0023E7778B|nr:hypothetical protein [Haloglomus sp. DT116]
MAPDRRDVLRASGGFAALLTGLAGCTEQIDDATGGGGPQPPGYASTLLDPAALVSTESRLFVSVDASAYAEQKAALPQQFRESVDQTTSDIEGTDPTDADRVSAVFGTDPGERREYGDESSVYSGIATGSFDAETLRSQAESGERLTSRGEYEGYSLYGGPSEYDYTRTTAVAISAEALVGATVDVPDPSGGSDGSELSATPDGATTAIDAVKAHIDTFGGGGSPLADADLATEMLAQTDGSPLIAGALTDGATIRRSYFGDGQGGTREPEDELGRDVMALTQDLAGVVGTGAAPETTSAETTVRLYYDSEDVVSDRAETLRSAIETAKARSDDVTPPETEVGTQGQAVLLTITGDPQRLSEEFGFGESSGGGSSRGTPVEAPQVAFAFEYASDGTLTIQHEGGDTVTTDLDVRYEADGEVQMETWTAPEDGISAGETYTTDMAVDSGSDVLVLWRGENASAVLAQSEAP